MLKGAGASALTVSFYLIYLALCLTPLIINLYADWRWRVVAKAGERNAAKL